MTDLILYPTRGGKGSHPNQNLVIQLAKDRSVDILFLYVANVQFLGLTARQKLVDVEAEIEEMGDFMLAMAQERAQNAGVKAYTTVRSGFFHQVLRAVFSEYPIGTVILGRSVAETGTTTPEYIQSLAEELCNEFKVEVIVLQEGEIAETFCPASEGPTDQGP